MAFPLTSPSINTSINTSTTATADTPDQDPQEVEEVAALVAGHTATPTAPPALTEEMRAAYLRLYDTAHENALRMARSMVAPEVAEDVAQETWMIMLRNWHRVYTHYEESGRLGYLFLVVKTKALDVLRKHQRQQKALVSLSIVGTTSDRAALNDMDCGTMANDALMAKLAEYIEGDSLPERVVEAREEWRHLLAHCRDARERLMLTLRGAAFTHDEIAVLLAESGVANVSTNAVKLALSRLIRRAHDTDVAAVAAAAQADEALPA